MILETIVVIFGVWIAILYAVKKKGGKHFTLMGPLVMWKTERGRKLIDKLARKKFWGVYGDIAIIITVIAMIFTTYLIIWNVVISFKIPPQNAPSPRLILGIPGINPVIPLWYGIAALALAIVFHEFSHGILARYGGIRVNSLGILFLILPVGAFVEPDEEKLMKAKARKRSRVFAAGPATNILIAVASMLIIAFVFSPAITPKENGVILTGNVVDMEKWGIISSIDGVKITGMDGVKEMVSKMQAGRFYNITYWKEKSMEKKYLHGIIVAGVVKGAPAYGNISSGSVIYSIDNTSMNNLTTFFNLMNSTGPGEVIRLSCYNGSFYNISITLADKYDFTENDKDRGKGFIGIMAAELDGMCVEPSFYANIYNPFKTNLFMFLSLPFHGLSPFPSQLASLYHVPLSPVFWVAMNFLYWLFWLNFALGTFNALPAIPLDGGYIFRDGVGYIIKRAGRLRGDKVEKISGNITTVISWIILIAILSILIIPRIRMFI
ncbi:MAG: site-2 protease family protein [Thermoplasmata archaeon]|nr:site-2 protease family protein [Thermoplasmata archaeon]